VLRAAALLEVLLLLVPRVPWYSRPMVLP